MEINLEQRLYVIPSGKGYSCLGFEVCEQRRVSYMQWLGLPVQPVEIGTPHAYAEYERALDLVRKRCVSPGVRCTVELVPELVRYERRRVEVTYPDGTKTRFIVGVSTGFIPVHLEIKTRRSTGGSQVYFPPGSTVRLVG